MPGDTPSLPVESVPPTKPYRDVPSPLAGSAVEWPSVPGYEILGELGRGGMGIVYEARQVRLSRTVALKVIRAGAAADPEELARFKAEAEAVARLQHPNVVQIFEVGEHQGRPYFALEYCGGGSLADRLRGAPLPPRAAAALAETLAQALDAAHRGGIVHRDLKPANVLLAGDGRRSAGEIEAPAAASPSLAGFVPKIADFGLAKRLDEVGQTQTGAVMGSFSYMAPEQARGHSRHVGLAADVYALGAVLYEMLTGRPPFRGATLLETLEQVVNADPVSPRRLQPKVPRDLETVCLKCLHKDPKRRYASAALLAEDLKRFVAGESVTARPIGSPERLARWCRRNPLASALATVAAAAVLLGAGLASYFAAAASRRAGDTEASLVRVRRHLYLADVTAARLAWEGKQFGLALEALEQHRPGAGGGPDPRGFEWHFLWRACRGDRLTLRGHRGAVVAVAFAPDGARLATASRDGTARVWDALSGEEALALRGHRGAVLAVAFAPDGGRLTTAGEDGAARVWAAVTGRELLAPAVEPDRVRCLAFSPDGRRLATASTPAAGLAPARAGRLVVWDAATGREELVLRGHADTVASVAFSPDGKTLASGDSGGEVRTWDAVTGAPALTLRLPGATIDQVAFGPGRGGAGGGHATRAEAPGVVAVWDTATGREVLSLSDRGGFVRGVYFSPDGTGLATASQDRAVKVWDARTGELLRAFEGHDGDVRGVCFSPDGRWLASASSDRTVKIWDADSVQVPTALGHPHEIRALAFSPDGRQLAAGGFGQEVMVWDVRGRRPALTFSTEQLSVAGVHFSADGRLLATGGYDKTVRLWEEGNGRAAGVLRGHTLPVTGVAFSRDGKRLVSAAGSAIRSDVPGEVIVWDVAAGREAARCQGHGGPVAGATFGPDGRLVATASWDRTARLWDAATGQEAHVLTGHDGRVTAVAFSPDGRLLASCSEDATVRVWDAASGREVRVLRGHSGWTECVAFSPDGQRLASGGRDKTVRLWDMETGQPTLSLRGHKQGVAALAFSPDGTRLASASEDKTVLIWDAPHAP